ncbi:RDD family protein [Streptomyces sp. TRM68367]|uniref:RDD family protein n=1 Tax=Streptomyces sp. TRM68367 TaxID=2758415 RepID=UPI00165B4F6F|nr:RDD family protein [Streptomyces sp. TRM68367]MBC9728611.1 RDD family protein [Streptomyces sp. TRM68367]
MSDLVTGEAVALELRPAKLPSRALAVLLDLAAAVAVYVVVTIVLVASTASLDEAAQTALSIATFVLLLVGGPIAVETLSHGRSLGKVACGLRVVRDDGGPIRFRHALVRGLIGVIEILMTFGVVACIASLVSARGRRLGDVFAGTLVVRERVPVAPAGFVPPPPPWLAGRFSELDLSAVPDGLWLAIRQYLTRMRQLDPQVGWSMAERLAAELAARTGAPAPEGVPPAAYLAAVVQERQAREARRAFGSGAAARAEQQSDGGAVPGELGAYGFPAAQSPTAAGYGAGSAWTERQGDVPSAEGPRSDVPQAGVPRTDPPRADVPRTDAPQAHVPADERQAAASPDAQADERPATRFVPPA